MAGGPVPTTRSVTCSCDGKGPEGTVTVGSLAMAAGNVVTTEFVVTTRPVAEGCEQSRN